MQNKAVINEEKANDVNLLREQIRQLKVGDTHARLSFNFELFNVKFSFYSSGNTFQDELTRMKMNSSQPAGNGSGYSNSWNARRSYNLLRLSLGHPMTFPIVDSDDNDEEMEIDDEAVDSEPVRSPAVVTMEDMTMEHTELSNSMEVVSKEARRSSLELEHGSGIVVVNDVGDDDSPNIELNATTVDITMKHTDLSKSMEMVFKEAGTSSLGKESGSRSVVVNNVGDDDDSPNVDSPAAATSEDIGRKDEELPNSVAMASKDVRLSTCEKESRSKSATVDTVGDDESPNIDSPTLGVMETQRTSLPALNISVIHDLLPSLQSPTCTHSPKELLVRLEEKIRQPPMFGLSALEEDCTVLDSLPKVLSAESSSLQSSLHNSKSFASPRDRLAASLHRGLQILDNHQNKSHASGGRWDHNKISLTEHDKFECSEFLVRRAETSNYFLFQLAI
jgi:kinesin family protein 15